MKSITTPAPAPPPPKCRGISKHTVKKDITKDDYPDTLFSSTEKTHSMKSIKSHNHN